MGHHLPQLVLNTLSQPAHSANGREAQQIDILDMLNLLMKVVFLFFVGTLALVPA